MTPPPEFLLRRPRIASSAFIAPTATLLGDVMVGEQASIWYGAVLRGDNAGFGGDDSFTRNL